MGIRKGGGGDRESERKREREKEREISRHLDKVYPTHGKGMFIIIEDLAKPNLLLMGRSKQIFSRRSLHFI